MFIAIFYAKRCNFCWHQHFWRVYYNTSLWRYDDVIWSKILLSFFWFKLNLLVKFYEKWITGTIIEKRIWSDFSIFRPHFCICIKLPLTKLQLFKIEWRYWPEIFRKREKLNFVWWKFRQASGLHQYLVFYDFSLGGGWWELKKSSAK